MSGLAGIAMLPHAISSAAEGPPAQAPADVFYVETDDGKCTGFAVTKNVVITAKHCEASTSTTLTSEDGKTPTIIKAMDSPDHDATVLVTDANDLNPFPVADITDSAELTVYGYGVTASEKLTGTLRSATLENTRMRDNEVMASTPSSGETICSGDSGGPAVQDGKVIGIVSAGDGDPCSKTYTTFAHLAPVYKWFQNTAASGDATSPSPSPSPEDTSPEDTSPSPSPEDTGPEDTGPEDTSPEDDWDDWDDWDGWGSWDSTSS